MRFIFHIGPFLRFLYRFRFNQRLSLSLAWVNFPGDSDVVSFRDATHHKYSIKTPKQDVILLGIES